MTIENPIADMLTRIRNASRKYHETVSIPHSQMKASIASLLKKNGYIDNVGVIEKSPVPVLELTLRYTGDRRQERAAITELKQVSKPSRRVYVGKDDIPHTLGELGLCILSTSEGYYVGE